MNRKLLEDFDPDPSFVASGHIRFACPLPACEGKPMDRVHQTLSLNESTGRWKCHRCGAAGLLAEFVSPAAKSVESNRDKLASVFSVR